MDFSESVYRDRCIQFFKTRYGFSFPQMISTATHGLEAIAIFLDLHDGDEIIIPSFTYVSTANAFALHGATIRFVDSLSTHPNMDVALIEKIINQNTRAIVLVHYGGVSCDMDLLSRILQKYPKILVIEDAAHCIDAFDTNQQALGTFGDFSVISFHHTKNIACGEGGLLHIKHEKDVQEMLVILNNGTNKTQYPTEYEWIGYGSSWKMSEVQAMYLWNQLQHVNAITFYRQYLSLLYRQNLSPEIETTECTGNGHIFYIITDQRSVVQSFLQENGFHSCPHYKALHQTPFGKKYTKPGEHFPNAEKFSKKLLRLPLDPVLTKQQILQVASLVNHSCGTSVSNHPRRDILCDNTPRPDNRPVTNSDPVNNRRPDTNQDTTTDRTMTGDVDTRIDRAQLPNRSMVSDTHVSIDGHVTSYFSKRSNTG